MTRTIGQPQYFRTAATIVAFLLFFVPPGAVCDASNSSNSNRTDDGVDSITNLSFLFPLVPGIHSSLVGLMQSMIATFNDANPDIRVSAIFSGSYTDTHAKVQDLVEAGTPPDVAVLNVNAYYDLVQDDAIIPLNDYITMAGGQTFLDQFYSSLLGGEVVYGMPVKRSTPLLYINRDLLRSVGVESAPTSWRQLVEDYEPITERLLDRGAYALAIPDTWTDWIFGAFSRQAGSQLIQDDWTTPTFNSPGNYEALSLWVELVRKNILPTPLVPWSNAIDQFVEGKVAMMYYTSGGISRIKASATFEWEAVFCPAGPAGYGVEEGGGDVHIFNNIPRNNQDAAWRLIRFLTSPEMAAKWSAASGYIAVNKAAYDMDVMKSVVEETPAYGVARDQFEYAHPQMMCEGINEVRDIVNSNLNDALTGSKTVSEALEDGQTGMLKVIRGGDLNQLGSIRFFGYALCGLVMILSVAFCAWTYLCRSKRVVMASQPLFLYMICGGCVIFVSTIIPLSLDDGIASVEACTRACRSIPWLLGTGFTIIFSALYSKIRRLNIVLKSGKKFRRIKVKERDVLVPLGLLFGVNVILLILWTVLDPLHWKRVPVPGSDGMDTYDTYGHCTADGTAWLPLLVLLVVANFLALILANLEACRASGLEIEFHESRYIGIATGLILQAFLIGIPLLVITLSNQAAQYFVSCALIFIVSSAVLLFIFVPKIAVDDKKRLSVQDGLRFSLRGENVRLLEVVQKVLHLRQLMDGKGIEETEELFREAGLHQVQTLLGSDIEASTSSFKLRSSHLSSSKWRFI